MSSFSIVPLEVCADDRLTKMQLRVLIALLSFRNKNTDTCFPKRKALSSRCGYTEQTISKITKQLVDLGWLQKQGLGGYSSPCKYKITVPELETVSKLETVPSSATKTVSEPGTITVSKPDTRKEQTIEQTIKQKPSLSSAITLGEHIEIAKAKGVKSIPENHRVFSYADEVGLPLDYLRLAWRKFVDYYKDGPGSKKKYIDWPATFCNNVKNNYNKLWWINDSGEFNLTTAGKQAEKEFANHE